MRYVMFARGMALASCAALASVAITHSKYGARPTAAWPLPVAQSHASVRAGAAAVREADGIRLFLTEENHDPVKLAPGQLARWGSWRFESEDLGTERPAFTTDPYDELIDLDSAGDCWRLRHWTPDDRFEPLGFGHEKNVGHFLADSGFSAERRRRIPVLEGPRGIVWVCGVRLAQSAALRPESRRIGRIHFFTTENDDA